MTTTATAIATPTLTYACDGHDDDDYYCRRCYYYHYHYHYHYHYYYYYYYYYYY